MLAKISASGIGELLTGGRTADSYLLKKAFESVGVVSDLSTKAMEHGIINQYEAFELIVSKIDNAKWHDVYTPINDYCGASADCVGDTAVYDIKCPFYIDTYLEQVATLPKKYYYQSQMQMIAEGKEYGCIVLYLTGSDMDIYGNKIEYPYPLEDRMHIHQLTFDEEAADRILTQSEKGSKKIKLWSDALLEAKEKDLDEFFYEQIKGLKKYRKLKTATNIDKALINTVKVGNEYYYEV